MMVTDQIWPALDYSRVPYRLYHDAEIYEREQRHIFQGPVWHYLGLEAEIPNPGDFRSTWLGEMPVVFNRDRAGNVKAFVNRCAIAAPWYGASFPATPRSTFASIISGATGSTAA